MVVQAIRDQLAARCYCTSANSITSLTVAEDYASGNSILLWGMVEVGTGWSGCRVAQPDCRCVCLC